jgi:hypothetical protein
MIARASRRKCASRIRDLQRRGVSSVRVTCEPTSRGGSACKRKVRLVCRHEIASKVERLVRIRYRRVSRERDAPVPSTSHHNGMMRLR